MLLPKIYPVTCHTDHVGPGSTFVAIKGYKEDGTQYIPVAIEKGATKIVVEENTQLSQKNPNPKNPNIEYIFVKNTRISLSELCAQALGRPAEKLNFIGVTGTSGKTTTTYLIEHVLKSNGYKTALLGSVKNKILDQEEEIALTTQSSDYIQMFLAECVKNEVQVVIMEVSSHGLALDRIHGIKFDVAGFTNLSPEHMDFHPTMEHYFATKMRLFENLQTGGLAVVNADDSWGQQAIKILEQQKKSVTGFGQQNCQLKFELLQNNLDGLKIKIENKTVISDKLLGEFNGYNISMAYLACKYFGVNPESIATAVQNFAGVPGRLQCHKLRNGAKAFVDYAHKPDAFEKVLKNLRPHTQDLIVVFGCGGNKDKTKRPVMGAAAAKYADKIVVTDDNPRDEDRQSIANEIIAGIPQEQQPKTICILDRNLAIEQAVKIAKNGSIIAILGKGHENYYIIKGQKSHFDDFEEICKF